MPSPVQVQVVESDPGGLTEIIRYPIRKIRYPIRMNIRYALFCRNRVLKTGAGTTVDISSSGILFEAEGLLPPGKVVHLTIEWPATIDDRAGLVLKIIGRTIRCQGECTAAVIVNREFRVRSLRTRAGDGMSGAR